MELSKYGVQSNSCQVKGGEMSTWLIFDNIIKNWKIWFAVAIVLCVICPLLVPVFGIAFLAVGIYAHKRKKASRSMFGWSIFMGALLMSLTIFYIVSMCTIHYGISSIYTTLP